MIVMLASCASLKTAFTGNKETASTSNSTAVKKESKFLDPVDMPVESSKEGKEKKHEKAAPKRKHQKPAIVLIGKAMQKIYLLCK